MRYNKLCQAMGLCVGLLVASVTLAEVLVVDASSPSMTQEVMQDDVRQSNSQVQRAPQPVARENLSEAQRLMRLENQQSNLTRMDLPQQLADLQQALAELRGQLQVQQHDLTRLVEQQRLFYQDLDQRLLKLEQSGSKVPSLASTKKTGSNNAFKESTAYQAAFSALEKKQYDASFAAFKRYLVDYPDGAYAVNAHYWMGEIDMAQKNTKSAVKRFQCVIHDYPNSNKVPDAKLKLAIIHANMGKQEEAKREFSAIKQHYPKTTAAKLAAIRLEQLAN